MAAEPEPYRFVMANNSASKNKVIANSEEIIARMLAVMLRRRMVDVGMDTGGVEPWAYHTVGGVQLATHSWMSHPRMSSGRADRLPDDAVLERAVRHRRGGRFPGEVPRNATPVADPSATVAQEMSNPSICQAVDARATSHLAFRPGDKVADIDTSATPGFKGKKADAAALQVERNERFAELQEMLYANSQRRRQPLGAAGAAGHGHRG